MAVKRKSDEEQVESKRPCTGQSVDRIPEDDMFADTPVAARDEGEQKLVPVKVNDNPDNWHDPDFYYKAHVGEIINEKYQVKGEIGAGMFSTVVLATNLGASSRPGEPEEVAIKIPRDNDTMKKSAKSELEMLQRITSEEENFCVRLVDCFEYRGHRCLVMENLDMNLRQVIKKYGRNIGLNLKTVRVYARQLLLALQHLTNRGIIHSDIKPDNILVTKAQSVIKLCDFGVAMLADAVMQSEYLVSPSYRAPEIILGLPYSHPLDMWSAGCCLYELYTGKFLFPAASNSDLLKLHLELKGPFPKSMLKRGALVSKHFDPQSFDFLQNGRKVTLKKNANLITELRAEGEDRLLLSRFKQLLDRMLTLDPSKRITPEEALKHPFFFDKVKPEPKPLPSQVTMFRPRSVRPLNGTV